MPYGHGTAWRGCAAYCLMRERNDLLVAGERSEASSALSLLSLGHRGRRPLSQADAVPSLPRVQRGAAERPRVYPMRPAIPTPIPTQSCERSEPRRAERSEASSVLSLLSRGHRGRRPLSQA